MDQYVVGQLLYRAYVNQAQGPYTAEFKVKSLHKGYVKITSESVMGRLTPGTEHEYTEAISAIINHFAPTPIEALEKLNMQKQCERDEHVGRIDDIETDIRAINRILMDDPPLELWGIYDKGNGNLVLAAQSEAQAWGTICAVKGRHRRDLEKQGYRCNKVLAREHWEFTIA